MLNNKVSLITGASRGIGRAIAIEFARNKSDIILNYHSNEKYAVETAEQIRKLGRKAVIVKADVGNYGEVASMMEIAKKEFGRINILVNNAGITMDRTLRKMTPEEWNSVITANLNGVYNVTHQSLPLIPEGGRIINISSISGISGNFGQCNYSASKAGVIGFTKSLARELGKEKITVNSIAPGLIESEMAGRIPHSRKKEMLSSISLGRLGAREDIVHCAVFLASDKAGYITGEVISVDGGMRL